MFKNLFKKPLPVDTIAEKTSLFVGPRVKAAEELPGNRIGQMTYETLMYVGAVAEAIGQRRLTSDERDWIVTKTFGSDFQKRVVHLSGKLEAMRSSGDEGFLRSNAQVREIARRDVQAGMLSCSNFLFDNAKAVSEWQERVANTPS